jgi:prepilin-type N-terminal cleavage/methylation domain-containing protein
MSPTSPRSHQSHSASRGFTLVEMLVVIGIIAVLAALLLPAVMMAVNAARRARMALEINQLASAIERYKEETGDYPPSFRDAGAFLRHVRRVYPQIAPTELFVFFKNNGSALTLDATGNPQFSTSPLPPLDEGEALVFWLGGGLGGLRDDRRFPLSPNSVGGAARNYKKRYPFDERRLEDLDGDGYPSFHPEYARETFYLYIDSRSYQECAKFAGGNYSDSADQYAYAEGGSSGSPPRENCCRPYWSENKTTSTLTGKRFQFKPVNPTTFQILCAGQDGDFGLFTSSGSTPDVDVKFYPTGTNYNVGGGDNDNMANFSDGSRLGDKIP